MTYRAMLTDAGEARESLLGLWGRNLPEGDWDARFRWFYQEAPWGPASAFLLQSDEGPDANINIGCAGVGGRTFYYQGRALSAALFADLAVDKRHRTALPALTLQRSVKQHAQSAFDFSYGYPNKSATAIHLRLGFHVLGKMGRWVRVLRHVEYLRRIISAPLLPQVGGALIDHAISLRRAPRTLKSFGLRRIDFLDDVDARFDDLWERSHRRYPILAQRTAAFLRWRYLADRSEGNRVVALSTRIGAELRAYAVVSPREHTAHLLDLFGASDQDVDHLLMLIMPALRKEGFAAVSMSYLGAPKLIAQLESHGFHLRERAHTVIVDPSARLPFDAALLRDANNWYLTDGDEDAL